MILTCPSCSTRYVAESARFLPGGRTVRCSSCGHTWHQGPPLDSALRAEMDDGLVDEPLGLPLMGPPPASPHWAGRVLGWLVLLVTLSAIGAASYRYRVEMVQLWPKSSILFSTLGIPVNTRGLAFRDTAYAQFREDDTPILSISGEIENITDDALPLPPIRVSLRDKLGREIYKWTFTLPKDHLDPAEKESFETRLGNPPGDARDLVVTFAAAGSFR